MTAKIIDGKAFAAGLTARVSEDVAKLKALHRIQPGLAVVLVGERKVRAPACVRRAQAPGS